MYKLTLIVRNYNRSNNIGKTLNSVIKNTFFNNTEVVIIDDCSTDNSLTLLQDYKRKYKNITLIRHDCNLGRFNGLITGITYVLQQTNQQATTSSNDEISANSSATTTTSSNSDNDEISANSSATTTTSSNSEISANSSATTTTSNNSEISANSSATTTTSSNSEISANCKAISMERSGNSNGVTANKHFVMFLDMDDTITRSYLEDMYNAIVKLQKSNENVWVVQTNTVNITDSCNYLRDTFSGISVGVYKFNVIKHLHSVHVWNKIYDVRALQNIIQDEIIRVPSMYNDDFFLNLLIAENLQYIGFVNTAGCYNYDNSVGLSHETGKGNYEGSMKMIVYMLAHDLVKRNKSLTIDFCKRLYWYFAKLRSDYILEFVLNENKKNPEKITIDKRMITHETPLIPLNI